MATTFSLRVHRALVIALITLACCASVLYAQSSSTVGSSEQPDPVPVVVPGEPITIDFAIPTAGRPAGLLEYEINPTRVVQLHSGRSGVITFESEPTKRLRVSLRLTVRPGQPSGRFVAASVALRWPDGGRESLPVWAVVRPSAQQATSAKNIDAEVVPIPESAAPGGTVRLRFAVYNNEASDERIRVTVVGGRDWQVDDREPIDREWLVEAYDEIEGYLDVIVPADAIVGHRQLIRLLVEVVGEPGVIEALNYVSVVKHGRGRPGAPIVSGSSTIGVSHLGGESIADARATGGLQFSTTFRSASSASFSYERGSRNTLSNYRYAEEETQVVGTLRHAGWEANFGNRLSSFGNAVAGPFVQGIGGLLQKRSGALIAEVAVAQPAQFSGDAGGLLVRGRAGWRHKQGSVAFLLSDFSRPEGGYTTVAPVQEIPLDADAQEQLDVERALTAEAPSNRVQGAGTEIELRVNQAHRFTARAGGLRLSNAAGDRLASAVGEATYSLSLRQLATVNARWREMPQTLRGVFIPGDERTFDGSFRALRPLWVVGRAFQNSSETVGRSFQSRTHGASAGLRYQRQAYRVEARWNHRETAGALRSVRRTVSLNAGLPLGPMRVGGHADVGTQDSGGAVSRAAFYRGDVRWTGRAGSLSFDMTHAESSGTRTQRADVIASYNVRRWELAGGAWATRGYRSGGAPGMWTSVGVPVGRELLVVIGVDRAPVEWVAAPTWRGTLAVRKRFSIPLPFGGRRPPSASSPPHASDEETVASARGLPGDAQSRPASRFN